MKITEIKTPKLIQDLGMLYPTNKSKKKKRFGIYECPYCKTNFKSFTSNIKNKHTKSCGCYQKERIGHLKNLSKTRLYQTYSDMKKRIFNKNHHTYAFYGAKGITMCNEWSKSFLIFREWALEHGYKDSLTIDRINPYGNYEPSNCRWIPMSEQHYNKKDLFVNNKSGYSGIYYCKERNKYTVSFTHKKIKYFIGYFDDINNAVDKYNQYIVDNKLDRKIYKVK